MMMKTNVTTQPRMMRMKQLTEYCALSRAFLYQLITDGEFPPGYMLSPGIRAWERSEIDEWLDRRMGKAA
ncbi:MAG: AlpA family phage regulatory protein [Gammaproteobacteria bacterium]|jgi:predicted DNA-binding transcriptional regulator AlpA|nr:AlpA family phage regulatory protein [Gammaproteobacteria bacterium]